jgi:hypothetical protein
MKNWTWHSHYLIPDVPAYPHTHAHTKPSWQPAGMDHVHLWSQGIIGSDGYTLRITDNLLCMVPLDQHFCDYREKKLLSQLMYSCHLLTNCRSNTSLGSNETNAIWPRRRYISQYENHLPETTVASLHVPSWHRHYEHNAAILILYVQCIN